MTPPAALPALPPVVTTNGPDALTSSQANACFVLLATLLPCGPEGEADPCGIEPSACVTESSDCVEWGRRR
jgi:hypothetical protein